MPGRFLLVAISFLAVAGLPVLAAEHPAPIKIAEAEAKAQAEMKPYTELIEHTDATIEMLPIPGGKFVMGSPD
jgi:hypothetical protein